MKMSIWITASFSAQHRWEKAPSEVSFLRNWHRHVFHVKVTFAVDHEERDLEFFIEKRKLEAFVRNHYQDCKFEKSCETIAREILDALAAEEVSVSEDNENGATVHA